MYLLITVAPRAVGAAVPRGAAVVPAGELAVELGGGRAWMKEEGESCEHGERRRDVGHRKGHASLSLSDDHYSTRRN